MRGLFHYPYPTLTRRRSRLTLLGRSTLLLASELLANAACWIVTGILFGRDASRQPILSLALLAWASIISHAIHHTKQLIPPFPLILNFIGLSNQFSISAIDNATRGLISLGQLPVTCGLFFSLGHSTIVIVVNVAIAISTDIADKIGGVGMVGGIVGSSVSATFLFIVGLANSIILYRALKKRRQNKKRRAEQLARGEAPNNMDDIVEDEDKYNRTIMMRILGPIVKFVDRPWKMYPVGVLFGFGFDTASSIALLAVSAVAKKRSRWEGHSIRRYRNPTYNDAKLLFTAGMTLLDSTDSILMLYSYSGFPERSFALFETIPEEPQNETIAAQAAAADIDAVAVTAARAPSAVDIEQRVFPPTHGQVIKPTEMTSSPEDGASQASLVGKNIDVNVREVEEIVKRDMRVKRNMISGLSIILTFMSILVAFCISLITIMGLIGDNCAQCQAAANAEDGGGLAGRWWRFWAKANDNSGYIGAAIVGAFLLVVGSCARARVGKLLPSSYFKTSTEGKSRGQRIQLAKTAENMTAYYGAIQAFRTIIPEPKDRVVMTWQIIPHTLSYFIPFAFMAYLARRPGTYTIRLLMLPSLISLTLHCAFGYTWQDPRLNVYNWGAGTSLLVDPMSHSHHKSRTGAQRCYLWASANSGPWRSPPSLRRRARTPPETRPRCTAPATASSLSGSKTPWNSCSPFAGSDGSTDAASTSPPHTRPLARGPFIRATICSLLTNFLALDLLEALMKRVPGVGDVFGGSIFLAFLPPVQRYALSTAIHFMTGCALLSGFQMVYDIFTLIAVALFGHSPSAWPPLMDNPWISTSLHEFWSKRWHQTLRQTFLVYGGIPGRAIAGDLGLLLGTFIASGLYHECSIYVMGRGWDSRVPLFFLMQAGALIGEKVWRQVTGRRVGGFFGLLWVYFNIMVVAQPLIDAWHSRGLAGGMIIPPPISPSRRLLFPAIQYLTGWQF
ncbi:hypothetical protein EW146_g1211 [Bondarzewia mesenterica]|uniref:Wax synthase domain-containing protein n=1 Tax=Bondarzewia mesenterica TaxID=1095465 RepID=A0A4S4M4K6_9AGAM|nr:hypothetical protein EW146_g1211 [Bondarzewia mesenterica]